MARALRPMHPLHLDYLEALRSRALSLVTGAPQGGRLMLSQFAPGWFAALTASVVIIAEAYALPVRQPPDLVPPSDTTRAHIRKIRSALGGTPPTALHGRDIPFKNGHHNSNAKVPYSVGITVPNQ
jgi:hypothetical protein